MTRRALSGRPWEWAAADGRWSGVAVCSAEGLVRVALSSLIADRQPFTEAGDS
jgi:hypothetical protein